jgi:hypothetical protein
MLLYSYKHISLESYPLVFGTIPTNPDNGYSHFYADSVGYSVSHIQDVRFYCETDHHERIIHFKTSEPGVRVIAHNGDARRNAPSLWNSALTLPDHTANLPKATGLLVFQMSDGGLHEFPFYTQEGYNWSMAGEGNGNTQGNGIRWECDDWLPNNQGNRYTTRHLIYVRIRPPPPADGR